MEVETPSKSHVRGSEKGSHDHITSTLPLLEDFDVPGHQSTADFGLPWSASFPLGLKLTKAIDLSESIDALQNLTRLGALSRLIKEHGGAIVIRGLPIETPHDYSKVAHAFGFRPHIEVGRLPLRTVLTPNVKTSNEGNRFEWHDDGSLSVIHVVLDWHDGEAVRIHDPTGARVFFGNVTSAWGRSRHHGATRPPFRGDDGSYHPPPTYGDGTPIDVDDLDLLLKLAEEGAIDVEWQKGDLVLLDMSTCL
ncbi:hypothetical protein CSAL01_05825 [Colletotrichum salicis]|uniref:TauD/TfdA-like domain-containing protein n=1 Tax=Colletotrichum salicis TaxID=1209931 RepID=A0A135V051_9PEZI|nr:hypothetical protein CSAL01_05825 [Colletotrichum salicis]